MYVILGILQVRLDGDTVLDRPDGHSTPCFLHITTTLARDTSNQITVTLSFMNPSDRDCWLSGLESARGFIGEQRIAGAHNRLLTLAARMRKEVSIADRFYHLIRYRKCFLGSEAVLWLIHDQKCSLQEAIACGNRMIDLGFFHHVTHEHFLCNSYLFYRFNDKTLAASNYSQTSDNKIAGNSVHCFSICCDELLIT